MNHDQLNCSQQGDHSFTITVLNYHIVTMFFKKKKARVRQQDEEQVVTKSLYHKAYTRQIDLLILDRLNPIGSNKEKI